MIKLWLSDEKFEVFQLKERLESQDSILIAIVRVVFRNFLKKLFTNTLPTEDVDRRFSFFEHRRKRTRISVKKHTLRNTVSIINNCANQVLIKMM